MKTIPKSIVMIMAKADPWNNFFLNLETDHAICSQFVDLFFPSEGVKEIRVIHTNQERDSPFLRCELIQKDGCESIRLFIPQLSSEFALTFDQQDFLVEKFGSDPFWVYISQF